MARYIYGSPDWYAGRAGSYGPADWLRGSGDDDYMYGYGGNDFLTGFAGRDTLYGGYGNDALVGGNDRDKLYGGSGNDVLVGGHGYDQLWGGAGQDFFSYRNMAITSAYEAPTYDNADIIWDFEYWNDYIVMPKMGRAENYSERHIGGRIEGNDRYNYNEAFEWAAFDAWTHNKDFVFITNGTDGYLFADRNGDDLIDIGIEMKGVSSLFQFEYSDIVNGVMEQPELTGWSTQVIDL